MRSTSSSSASPFKTTATWSSEQTVRLDQENILRTIIRGIASADLIVADLTGLNANVFYELGVAHTLEIPTILLTQDIETLPFDLRSYTANEYSVHFARASEIADKINEIGRGRNEGTVVFGNPITDFLPPDARERLGKGPRVGTPGTAVVVPSDGDEDLGPEEEELGFVDLGLQAEEANERFTMAMGAITEATERVGAQMVERTTDLEALTATGGGGESVKAANLLAIRIAADPDRYANVIEEHLPDAQGGADGLMDSINRRIALWQEIPGSTTRDQLSENLDTFISLRAATNESVQSLREYRDTVRGIRGFSRHVNNASNRIVRGLDELIRLSENVEAQSGRAIAVIGDLLDSLEEEAS
jgi:hypothetical protein